MHTKSERVEAVTDRKTEMILIWTLLWVFDFVSYARKELEQFRSHAIPVFFTLW
jgi:hypothetical protein